MYKYLPKHRPEVNTRDVCPVVMASDGLLATCVPPTTQHGYLLGKELGQPPQRLSPTSLFRRSFTLTVAANAPSLVGIEVAHSCEPADDLGLDGHARR